MKSTAAKTDQNNNIDKFFKNQDENEINNDDLGSEKPKSARGTIGIDIQEHELDNIKNLAKKRSDTEEMMEGLGCKASGESSKNSKRSNMN